VQCGCNLRFDFPFLSKSNSPWQTLTTGLLSMLSPRDAFPFWESVPRFCETCIIFNDFSPFWNPLPPPLYPPVLKAAQLPVVKYSPWPTTILSSGAQLLEVDPLLSIFCCWDLTPHWVRPFPFLPLYIIFPCTVCWCNPPPLWVFSIHPLIQMRTIPVPPTTMSNWFPFLHKMTLLSEVWPSFTVLHCGFLHPSPSS